MSPTRELHLPDECWEFVFRFLNEQCYFESLSLVCKQFLSITNSLRFSLTICNHTFTFLPRLFHRFPNLTSLDLTHFHGDLNALLLQISRSSLDLKSLKITNHPMMPADGSHNLVKKMRTSTHFTSLNVHFLRDSDLILIAHIFPFLEALDLSLPKIPIELSKLYRSNGPVSDLGVKALSLALPKLRKVILSGIFLITDESLFSLCKNCEFLEEISIFKCRLITQLGIASAIRERPNLKTLSVDDFGDFYVSSHFIDSLVSLKSLTCLQLYLPSISDKELFSIPMEGLPLRKLVLSFCSNYSYAGIRCLLTKCRFVQHLDLQNAKFLNDQHVAELSVFLSDLKFINLRSCRMLTNSAFFALIRNCPLLSEIRMENTHIGGKGVEDSNSLMDFVNPQVKSLHLGHNARLSDENIKIFVSICPNLELLDLTYCLGISEGIVEVLRRCHNTRHLNLAGYLGVKLHGMNFGMPKLEVLNLSSSTINDETLSVISKSCCRLLHLNLQYCPGITAKGVRQVVDNCTQLREINLRYCDEVAADVVAWMVFSRPSLRKIIAPSLFSSSGIQRELLLRHGCLVWFDLTRQCEIVEVP